MTCSIRQPARHRSVQNLRQRMILETEAFLNRQLAKSVRRSIPTPDTVSPALVQCARQVPEPLFVVFVSPWSAGVEEIDLLALEGNAVALSLRTNGGSTASPLPAASGRVAASVGRPLAVPGLEESVGAAMDRLQEVALA